MALPRDVAPGEEVLGYHIERVIGRGGMGIVCQAHHQILDRRVALKLLLPELAQDEAFRERFLRESRLAASLEHPAIVPLYDAGRAGDLLYLAMRYVEGGDLGAVIAREAPLEPGRALGYLSRVAAALDAAHAQGLVHRDVKPGNILVDGEGSYLADFGLAKSLAEPGRVDESHHLASAAYVAPEQIERGPVGPATDVYSLGCVLYECLCGVPPFKGDTLAGVLFDHLESEPAPARSIDERLPRELDAVFERALAKDPADRQQTCGELVHDARRALGLEPRDRRRYVIAVAVAVAVAAAVALAGLASTQLGGGDDAPSRTPVEDSVARLDPRSGAVAAVVPVGGKPTSVAVGDDVVWVINQRDGTVSEIDPRTSTLRRTVRLAGNVPDVGLTAIAADGKVAWIATRTAGVTSLMRVDEQSGEFASEFTIGKVDPIALAAGEGHVWLLGKDLRGNVVLKIDAAARRVAARAYVSAGETVTDLAVGEGAVWFTDWQREETLSRLDPETMRVTARVDAPGDDAVAVGAGSVWLADIEAGTLVRVDPLSMAVTNRFRLFEPPFLASVDLTVWDGYVWLSYLEGRTVYQVDPRTNEVAAEIPIDLPPTDLPFPPGPKGIAGGPHGVWVAIGAQ